MKDLEAHLETLAGDPLNSAALDAVEAAYGEGDRWEELLRLYEGNALIAGDADAAALYCRAATLCLERLSSAQRAESYLEQALERAPRAVEPMRQLRQLCLERHDYKRAIVLYEGELHWTDDVGTRSSGWVEVARLYDEHLGEPGKAIKALQKALEFSPYDFEVRSRMAELHGRQGRWDLALTGFMDEANPEHADPRGLEGLGTLAARLLNRPACHGQVDQALDWILENRPEDEGALSLRSSLETYQDTWETRLLDLGAQIEALSEGGEEGSARKAANLWFESGQIQKVYANDEDAALEAVERVVSLEPGHREGLREYIALMRERERFEELAGMLENLAAYTRDPALTVELLEEGVELRRGELEQPEEMLRLSRRILELDPGNTFANESIVEHHVAVKDWSGVVEVFEEWIERASFLEDKITAHLGFATLLEDEMNQPEVAQEHYESVIRYNPSHPRAVLALEPAYRDTAEPFVYACLLRAKLEFCEGEARENALQELGELYDNELERPADALDVLGELFLRKPGEALAKRLEDLAMRSGEYGRLTGVLESSLAGAETIAEKTSLLFSLAELYESERGSVDDALGAYRSILALAPGDARAQEGYERLLELSSESSDKIDFYEERLEEAESDGERVTLMHRLGTELAGTSKNDPQAIDVYRKIIQLVPNDRSALDMISMLYRREGRWAEMVDVMNHELQFLTDVKARALQHLDIAQVLESHLSRIDDACANYCAAIDESMNIEGEGNYHVEGANEGLERLLPRSSEAAKFADYLQRHYERIGHWEGVADVMEHRVQRSEDVAERCRILRELAGVYETRLSKDSSAVGAMLRVFQADPEDAPTRLELCRLGEGLGNYSDIVVAYRASAGGLDPAGRDDLLTQAAVLAEKDGDFGGAMGDYLETLFWDESRGVSVDEALERMMHGGLEPARILATAKDASWGDEDPMGRARLLVHLATFFEERMDDLDASLRAWRASGELNPADVEADQNVERLLREVGAPADKIDYFQGRLKTTSDEAGRVALLLEIAQVFREELSQFSDAIEVVEEAVAIRPGKRELWGMLAELYAEVEDLSGVAQAMEHEVKLVSDQEERASCLMEYAELLGFKLEDDASAFGAARAVLGDFPGHKGALELMRRLHRRCGDAELLTQLESALVEGYQAGEQWASLSELLSECLARETRASERARLSELLAEIQGEHLLDNAAAFDTSMEAFRESPTLNAARRLEDLASGEQDWNKLLELFAEVKIPSQEEAGDDSFFRMGDILYYRLERAQEALEYYRRGIAVGLPADAELLARAEAVFRELGETEGLTVILEERLSRVGDAEDKGALLDELAELHGGRSDGNERALTHLRELVARDEAKMEHLRALEELLRMSERFEEHLDVVDRLVALGESNPNLLEDTMAQGQTLESLNRDEEAFVAYRTVLSREKTYEPAIRGLEYLLERGVHVAEVVQVLEPVYTAASDYARLASVLEKGVDVATDRDKRKATLRRIGDLYENRLEDRHRAFEIACRALGEDPADMGIRMWVEKLALELNAMEDLADAYMEEAGRAGPPVDLQLRRRAASILHETVGDYFRAIEQYRAILKSRPEDEKSRDALEACYRELEDWTSLIKLLQERVDSPGDVEKRRELLNEIGELQLSKVNSPAGALETYLALYDLAPDDFAVTRKIDALYRHQERFDELDEFYARLAEAVRLSPDGEGRERHEETLFKRAALLFEELDDRSGALGVFEELLEKNPAHEGVVAFLEQVEPPGDEMVKALLERAYGKRGEWDKVLERLNHELESTLEPEPRGKLFCRIAEVYEGDLSSVELALGVLRRGVSENPADESLVSAFEGLAERHDEWVEYVDGVSCVLDGHMESAVRQRLLKRLAGVCEDELEDVDDAIRYLEQAHENEPEDLSAVEALERLCVRHDRWGALVGALKCRLAVSEDVEDKVACLQRIAQVAEEELGDQGAALESYQEILSLQDGNQVALVELERLHELRDDWAALAGVLGEETAIFDEPEELLRVHRKAAEIWMDKLESPEKALQEWLSVLELEPGDSEALEWVESWYRESQRWDELSALLEGKLEGGLDVEGRREVQRDLGRLFRDELGQGERAMAAWQQVLESAPDDVEALRALLELYLAEGRWGDVTHVAGQLVPLVERDDANALRLLSAELHFEKMEDKSGALALGRSIMGTHSGDIEVLGRLNALLRTMQCFEDAVEIEGQLLGLEVDDDGRAERYHALASLYSQELEQAVEARECLQSVLELRPLDLKAFGLLQGLYREAGLWWELRELNEDFVERVPAEERSALLKETRDVLREELGESDLAFIAACRFYREDPEADDAAEVVERLALETGSAEEGALTLNDECDRIKAVDARIAVVLRVARLYADEVQDVAAAQEACRRALKWDDGNLEALDRLSDLAAEEERFDKQLAALEQKLQHVEELEDKKEILFLATRIWRDEVEDGESAIDSCLRILSLDPDDMQALVLLAGLYEGEDDLLNLVETLKRQVPLSASPEAEKATRLRIAGLYENELEDLPAAMEWYRSVAEKQPTNRESLGGLERLYEKGALWRELVEVLEAGVDEGEAGEHGVARLQKIARIYESELNDPGSAAATHRRCLVLDPTNGVSLGHLERQLGEMGDWESLAAFLREQLLLASDDGERASLHTRLGDTYLRELSEWELARESYLSAQALDSGHVAAFEGMAALHERMGEWSEALEMLHAGLRACRDEADKVPGLLRAGTIYKDMLSELPAAGDAFLRALELSPHHPVALRGLKEIAARGEDWDVYEDRLLAELESVQEPEVVRGLYLEAGRFYAGEREDDERAALLLERLLEEEPSHPEARREVAELYYRNENWTGAGASYQRIVDALDASVDAREFAQKSYRLGVIHEKLGDPERAVGHYQGAVDADPAYLTALEALCLALMALERWEEALQVLERLLDDHGEALTGWERVEFEVLLAEICMKLGREEQGRSAYFRALQHEPNHLAALRGLGELERSLEHWGDAAKILSRYAAVAPLEERAGIYEEVAAIHEERLNDQAGCIVALERAGECVNAGVEVYRRLADQYLATHRSNDAAWALKKVIAQASEPDEVSELYWDLAQVFGEQLDDMPNALKCLNLALDAAPTNVKAFQEIEQILTRRDEWVLLEENYRAMIARAQVLSPKVRLILWRNLAQLYTRVLDDVDNAIMAYEVLRKLEPEKEENATMLAELYTRKPALRSKGIQNYHELLEEGADFVPMVKSLRRLYHSEQAFDEVYVCCSALRWLKSADEEETRIYDYLGQGIPRWPTTPMLEEHWARVLHPGLGGPIGEIAAELYRAAPDFVTRSARQAGLSRKDYVDLESDLFFVGVVRRVMGLLSIHGVELCHRKGALEPLHLVNAQPPALVVGDKNEIFRSADQGWVRFQVGRMLAYARPELFLARVFPAATLRNMLFGLCRVYNHGVQHSGDELEVVEWTGIFERMPVEVLGRLNAMVRQVYPALLDGGALTSYLEAVELSAARAGLVATGDLGVALNGVAQVSDGVIALDEGAQTRDLLLFYVSQGYLSLRRECGASIQVESGG
ncbi:MAG: tetratricopeptide repeat protein [Myxococcota bacterium]|nr:tetratricopeptide repeat protein [Myxococcota bacterium]